MPQGIRRPHEAVDYDALTRMYPPPPEYFETTWLEDRERIEAKQLARVQDRALRAYRVPFFQRRWDAAGFDPRGVQSLADLDRIPMGAGGGQLVRESPERVLGRLARPGVVERARDDHVRAGRDRFARGRLRGQLGPPVNARRLR